MEAQRVKREEDRIKRLEDAEVSIESVIRMDAIFSLNRHKINISDCSVLITVMSVV